jgi:hypothetical protein
MVYSTLYCILHCTSLCTALHSALHCTLHCTLHSAHYNIMPCPALPCPGLAWPALSCPARYLLLTSAQFFPVLGSTAHLSKVQLRYDQFCSVWFCTAQYYLAELKRLCTVLLSNGLYCSVVPITYLYCSGLLSNTQ